MSQPDWSLWNSFAAVVEQGSLSAAARQLGLSQPTLGRHIEALEASLGVNLFERSLQGLRPNDTALRLYEPVSAARTRLAEASLIAEGRNTQPSGTVRLTSSTVMCHYVLPGILAGIRLEHPQIAIELVPSDAVENLLLREADIAVRMFRPTQLDLTTRHIGDIPIVACAHESYLERRGRPEKIADLMHHDLIGFDRSDVMVEGARQLGLPVTRDSFRVRTDSQTALWELTKAGLGVSFAQLAVVNSTPGMVRLLPELRLPGLEVWLTTHRELFTSRRIRAIYDALGEGLSTFLAGTLA